MKETMKRCLALFLAVAVVMSGLPMNAFASEATTISEDHVHTDDCNHDDEVSTASEDSEDDADAKEETTKEEVPSKETTTKESTSKSGEKTQVEKVQEQIDAILKTYLGTTEMSLKEIEKVVEDMDADTLFLAQCDLEDLLLSDSFEKLSEKQADSLEENNDVFVNFCKALNEKSNKDSSAIGVYASGSFTVANGKITMAYSGNNSADKGQKNSETSATFQAWASGLWRGSTNTITITNTSGSKGIFSFDYSISGDCSACSLGKTSGNGAYSKEFESGGTDTITLTGKGGLTGGAEPQLVLTNINFVEAVENPEITVEYDSLGTVTLDGESVDSGASKEVVMGDEVSLVASASSGNIFLGWIDTANNKLLSQNVTYTFKAINDITVKAVFTNSSLNAYFRIGDAYLFDDLNKAATKAKENDATVVLASDGVLSSGNYTIPSGVTLLIPFDETDTGYVDKPASVKDAEYAKTRTPSAYKTLTMESGANIVVNGTMSVSAEQFAAGGSERGAGMPYKTYGYVKMADNSSITVNSNGKLAVYGYISGSGEILAKSGSNIYESFQFEDFRGGSKTSDMKNKVFMLSQYYVQNIEVPLTLESGATEHSYASIEALEMAAGSSVKFISSSGAMFNLTNGAVTKWYDKATDRLIIEAEGDIEVNPLSMRISIYSINSAEYVLPINGNMTLNVKSGSIKLNQDIALLPGAKINVSKGVTCTLGADTSVYVYDADQWGGYCGPSDAKLFPVSYVPERVYTRTEADLVDAELNVEGTMDASAGFVYTTTSGANIQGIEGAVAIINSAEDTMTYQYKQVTDSYDSIAVNSAKLKNADGTSLSSGLSSTVNTYTYTNGKWVCTNHNATPTCTTDATCTICNTYFEALDHDWNEGEVTIAPKCEVKGEAKFTCQRENCGETKIEEVAATDHDWNEGKVTKAATCTEDGVKTYTCKNDATHTYTETIPALEHAYESTITKAATCTEDGVKTYTCKNDATHTYTEPIPATGHTEVVIKAVAATCTATGLTEGEKCSVCGEILVAQEEIPMTDHQLDDGDILIPATCKSEGKLQYACQNCDYTKDEVIPVDSDAHIWTVDERVEPTCTEDGSEILYCYNVCGIEDKTKVLPALGHEPGEEATCETAQTCQRENCGIELVAALDHDWDDGEVTEEATCTKVGTKQYVCQRDNCNKTKTEDIPKLAHVNGNTVVEKIVDPTCTEKGHYDNVIYCTVGGEELSRKTIVTEALGHTEAVLDAVAPTCTEAGLTEGKKCTVCGETTLAQTVVDALGHDYESEVTKAATCTTDGVKTFTCSNDASHTYTEKIPATGHTEETVAGKAATCTEAGLTEGKKCTVCGETTVAQETIQATGHNIDRNNGAVLKAATCKDPGTIQYSCINDNCKVTEVETLPIDSNAHIWELDETEEPKCEVEGKEIYTCKLCGATDEKVLPALKHIPGEEATCTTSQTCQRENCGKELVAQLGHDWADDEVLEEATCTEAGTMQLACQRKNCDETKTEEIPKLAHVEGEVVIENNVDPTCTEKGHYDNVIYCTVGGEELSRETVVVDALGHTEAVLDAVAPTCTEDGLTAGVKCSVCDEVLTEQTVVDALGHDWNDGEITTAPTCTEAGVKTFTCKNDGTHTYTTVVDALGHTEGEAVVENKVDATCTTAGSYESVVCCTVCGVELSRTTETIPTIPHTEGTPVIENKEESTCTKQGSHDSVVYCTVCNTELSREKEVYGLKEHIKGNDATCTEDATCENCSYVFEKALGHNHVLVNKEAATCTTTGLETYKCSRCPDSYEVELEALGHNMFYQDKIDPTCTEPGKAATGYCITCNQLFDGVVIPALGHDYKGEVTTAPTCTVSGVETFTCSRCDDTYDKPIDALGHTEEVLPAVAPSCTETGLTEGKKCTVCGETTVPQTVVDALGHEEETIAGKDATCTEAGLTEGKKCTVCGETTVPQTAIDPLGHTDGEVVVENKKEATCTTAGSYQNVVYCSVCGDEVSKVTVTVAALGHTEETVAGKAATCTEDGLTEGTKCSVCGETLVEQYKIEAKGHTNGEVDVENEVAATCTEPGSYDNVVYCVVCKEEQSRETITTDALGHTEETVVGKAATCTEPGFTEGTKCSVCGETLVEQEEIPALGHTEGEAARENETTPTCVKKGRYDNVVRCVICNTELSKETVTVDALGHTEETVAGYDATCTESGLKDGKKCSVCGVTTENQEIIPAKGHTNEEVCVENGKAPSCTEEGSYDNVVYCAVCDAEVSRETVIVEALGHTDETIPAVAATCTATGLTEGKKCSVCGEILEAQEEIEANGHTEEVVPAVNPTCTATGLTEGMKCSVCDEILVAQEEIEANGHTEETIPAVDATCTATGLTEGEKCSVCGEILVAQEEVAANGHSNSDPVKENNVEATCIEEGSYDNVVYCAVCDAEVSRETVPVDALGHTEKVLEAVESTCTATGLTEGKECSVCGEVLVVQEEVAAKGHVEAEAVKENEKAANCVREGRYDSVVYCTVCEEELSRETVPVAALGHKEVIDEAVEATCTESGLKEGKHCEVCNMVTVIQEKIPAKGHTNEEVCVENGSASSCTEEGSYDNVVYCAVCDAEVSRETVIVEALGHTDETIPAVDATCTETGLTEGKKCSVCGEILEAQEEIEANGHTEEVVPAVNPTCTETGLTEGMKCSVCDEILGAQEEIEANGHTEETIPAVDPTCSATGLTVGTKCSVCDEILEAQEEVPMLDHTWNRGIITLTPNCTEDGERKFTCTVCGETKVEVEPMLGHDLEQVEGKKPTFTDNGYKDYERCLRDDCGYTTYEVIPALGEQSVETFDEFIKYLEILENIADEYVKTKAPGKDPAALIIKYIRTGVDRYNSGSWQIMAGYEDTDFAKFVKEYEATYNAELEDDEELMAVTGMKNIEEFTLPNGDHADIGHVFGTMDITYTNNSNADVGGWAGDLVDLMSLADQFGVESTTVEEMVEEINTKYYFKYREDFSEEVIEGTFSKTDVYGDLDAIYIMKTLKGQEYENGTLTKIFKNYMTPSLTDVQRAAYFLNNRLNGETLRSDVREAVYNAYLAEKAVTTLESTREFKTKDLTNLRKAVCYVFADYICKLAGDWVDTTENDYLEVFQSTSSTLAPGITQKIHHATTADGKTMVYYTATADITRSDVNVYANYNNNDPGAGWQMSRVLDQANAAQEKYGNPESPYYIENYNVIASINGDGFNMSTGEPGGLLVMDGYEWHPCDGNGFFAILADGTAKIGTLEEYKQLKAENKVKEAIGAFGTSLVKDGKINITASGDYYSDRAGRTAVGITKSGKVVFLVIDGRQGEFSCGASAIEIAQVMLDAGCYQAVNLDGGGSTTYVAREEGSDSLAVVSKPSDGAARSVSTSLMMVSTAPSSTVFEKAVLESDYAYLTEGATAQFKASGVSATGNAVELPEGVKWEVADQSVGTISEDGVFTAKGLGTTEVQLTLDGNVVGSKKINVVIPDSVYFSRDEMNTICGQESVLPVKAAYAGKSVAILEKDVILTLANEAAGTLDGFTFVPSEESGLKKVTVTAQLAENEEAATASMVLNIYTEDEAMFDFDKATGGDPQLAWEREVSNAVDQGNNLYNVIDREKDMETSYTFAIDMSKIDIPAQLADLTYMLPGSDMENASAWNFLLQLAERVSVLTEVKATLDFDDNMDVDYSEMSVSNEYFIYDKGDGVEFDEETNTLTLKMKWKDQVGPIDPETANPLCIVTNIKLTPKDDANWGAKEQLNVVNVGDISYNIYLRANALFTFASKPENQEIFGLTPFESTYIDVSGQEAPERGASFGSVYKVFEDQYSLNKGVKDGWVIEEGGFAYYKDGEKLTGIQEIDGLYYNFGETGINKGQKPCHGKETDLDGKEYYFDDGERVSGWIIIDETDVNYYNPETFVSEKLTANEKPSTCIIDGYCDYTSESGATQHVPYDDAGGHEYVIQGGSYVCTECGHVRVEMSEADVKLSYYVTTYTGTARTPATIVVAKNGVTLAKPPADYPDYSSKYNNNVEVGTASVTMTAAKYGIYSDLNTWRGNAAGSVTVNYEIRPDLPASVTAKTSGTKINVSWEAAKAPGVTYVVYVTKDGETWTEYATTNVLSYQLSTTNKFTSVKIGTRKVVDGKTYDSIETTEEVAFELNVMADNREDGLPTLRWNAMANAVSYEVYRSTSANGTYAKVFTTEGTTYTHVSAATGKTYYYKLKVIYADGKTETSEILTNEYLKPAEDFIFTLGHRADGKPTVKWNPLVNAASYDVYRSDTKNGPWLKTFTTKGVTYTNTAAQPGGTYYYKVTVTYKDGTTMTSDVVSNNCLILDKKITVSTSNNTNGKVVVKWNASAGVSSYEVYVASSKSGTYTKKATTTDTSYTHSSGAAGKTYYYKVKVSYTDKTTKTSSIVSKKCLYVAKPKVTVTNRADGKNVVKWKKLSGATSYQVYVASSKNGKYTKKATTKSTSYTHTSGKAGKTYYYKVKVTYKDKTTKTSDVEKLKCQKPSTKIKVKTSNASNGKPVLKWNAIKKGSKFTIYRATSKKGTYKKIATTTGLSYTDAKATAGKTYYYKVKVTYTNKKTKTSSIVSKKCLKK